MFATVIAIICLQGSCSEKMITNSDVDSRVTFMSCVAGGGMINGAKWLVDNGYEARGYTLANVRCVAGRYVPKVQS